MIAKLHIDEPGYLDPNLKIINELELRPPFLAPAEGCILQLHQWGPSGPPKSPVEFDPICEKYCGTFC